MPVNKLRIALALLIIVSISYYSCNNHAGNIPFPYQTGAYPQPVTTPLHLTPPKLLKKVIIKTGAIHPEIKKLNLASLPATTLLTDPFKPFPKPPRVTHFNPNSLPTAPFNLSKIPSKPLHYKTYILPPPVVTKAAILIPKSGVQLAVYEIAQAQGLSDKTILCFLKDRQGFIWIGTSNGLYRYDGEYLESYLPGVPATSLLEDRTGRFWLTNAGGIQIMDPKNRTITHFLDFNAPSQSLENMLQDDSGNIWVANLLNSPVIVINPQVLTYKALDKTTGLSLTRTFDLLEDRNHNIWITGFGGVAIINKKNNDISYLKREDGLGSDTTDGITSDQQGNIWVGSFRNGSVDAINMNNGTITDYGPPQGLNFPGVLRLKMDHLHRLWLATRNALAILDPQANKVKIFNSPDGIPSDIIAGFLKDNRQRMWVATVDNGVNIVGQQAQLVNPIGKKQISTQYADSKGNIWIGTQTEGIYIMNEKDNTVRHLNKSDGLSNNFIETFMESQGKIWVTSFGGLDIIDPANNTLEHIGEKEGLVTDSVYSIIEDQQNDIWLTGPSGGIQIINAARDTIWNVTTKEGLSDNNILTVATDKQGQVWLATYTGGMDIIDPKTWTIQYLNDAPGLKDTCYRELMEDEYGRTWIGTDKGIYVADPVHKTLTSISKREGLSNNDAQSLTEYRNQVLSGNYHQANIITPPEPGSSDKNWKISLMSGTEGLTMSTTNIWDINKVDSEGRYYWGDIGITIINGIKPVNDSEKTFITGINLMGQEQHFAKAFSINNKDTLWTNDSFFVKGETPINTGYVTKGTLQWDSLAGPFHIPVNLQIPYNKNYIQFEYGQQNSGRTDTVYYSYILDGIDTHWSDPTDKDETINYMNLPAGHYVFKVRSKNISGLWGKPAVFSFTITPPWWKTWWAYVLYIIVIGGLIWGFIEYRSSQLLRENKLLEEKVARRTKQLQESLENLKATQSQLIQSEKMASLGELTAGIAHEIQNPLNFVNNFSEVNKELIAEMKEEIDKGNYDEVKEIAKDITDNEEKINFHGKRAEAIVKSMLQHSRKSSGQKEPTDINALADEYLRLSYHGLRAKDKTFNAKFETNFDESIGKLNIVGQDIGRVLLNLFNNAFYAVTDKKKIAGENYQPTVSVTTKKINDKVEIKVQDNGNGIPQEVRDKIFQPFFTTKPTGQGTGLGLSLSYDIIRAHGGEIKAESKDGEGTEFIILLPVA